MVLLITKGSRDMECLAVASSCAANVTTCYHYKTINKTWFRDSENDISQLQTGIRLTGSKCVHGPTTGNSSSFLHIVN